MHGSHNSKGKLFLKIALMAAGVYLILLLAGSYYHWILLIGIVAFALSLYESAKAKQHDHAPEVTPEAAPVTPVVSETVAPEAPAPAATEATDPNQPNA